jgi:hypothetical protein
VIIDRGKIIADDSVASLIASGRQGARVSVELEATNDEARAALQALDSVAAVDLLDTGPGSGANVPAKRARFAVSGRAGLDPRRQIFELAAARGWPLWELHLQQESLEDLFLQLTVPEGGGDAVGDAVAETDDAGGGAADAMAEASDAESGR